MSTFRNSTILALSVALALAAGSASATNGYYTHGAGTKSKGQAGAGSANPEELMILATNPAGLTAMPETIDAGLGIFSPMRDYRTSASQAMGNCMPPGGPPPIGKPRGIGCMSLRGRGGPESRATDTVRIFSGLWQPGL